MVQIHTATIPIYQSCREGNEGVLHKIPIVVGNLRELNRHTPSDFAKFP